MDNETIKHSATDRTIAVLEPPKIHMHNKSDSNLSATTRYPCSMSNIDLGMHSIPPRIITKDASYSFIWIDDYCQNLSMSHDKQKVSRVSSRGFCNLITILVIISIILFLFLYPFITFYILPIYFRNDQ